MAKKLHSLRVVLLLVVGLWGSLSAYPASKSKYNTFTKSYRNARLEQVLADLQSKTGYKIQYVEEDIDLNKRVTLQFKNQSARAVLRKVLDKELQVTVKKGVITISRKPMPPQEIKVPAVIPTRVEEDSLQSVTVYEDTTYTIHCKTETKELPKEEPAQPVYTAKGHYLQGYAGIGYSRLGYTPARGKDAAKGSAGATIGLNYAYYFHDNWGAVAGIGFDYYGDRTVINDCYEWQGQGDSDGEAYTHRVYGHGWTEKQNAGMLNIPIGIQMMYPLSKKEKPLKLYADAGVQAGIPVWKTYRLLSGEIEHRGWYPQWNMEIHDQTDRDFYYEGVENFGKEQGKLQLSSVAVGVFAGLGIAFPLAEQWDIMAGVFAKVTCNNMYSGNNLDLGWGNSRFTQYVSDGGNVPQPVSHDFMNPYEGFVNSKEVGTVRPWMVGVRVGFNWHHKEKAHPAVPQYERIQICDTTMTLTERRETVLKPQPLSSQKIATLMERSIIWFDLDSWVPKLEPADIIDRIADILIENPEQRILVNGHASSEGNEEHNQMLSDKRAEAVVRLLIQKGVKPEQITSKGFSSSIRYIQEDSSPDRHNISLDRRVEIIPVQ
ncbi:MAG: OmpA family protein [Paludibacteraceae bacterium]|nr:OmpA family protein [Paludibacteraceae bacterium]MBQ6749018.1 OmpA family protein [Paludibacteraceae bacterium]MBR0064959.1 OmpA family protein [Paludibacteraceae bacterium]